MQDGKQSCEAINQTAEGMLASVSGPGHKAQSPSQLKWEVTRKRHPDGGEGRRKSWGSGTHHGEKGGCLGAVLG